MRKTAACLFCIICFAGAIEYSHRIQALGTDFAYLIPDYETDLYRDVELFEKTFIGLSYAPHTYIPIPSPLRLILLTKRFGWYGEYWGDSWYDFDAFPGGFWDSYKNYYISFNDLWMLDMRGHIWKILEGVWNVYNDGYLQKEEWRDASDFPREKIKLAYFFKAQGTHKLGRFLRLNGIDGWAFYWKREREYGIDRMNELLWMPSGRIGLFYRNAPTPNEFTSWFIDIGGPITTVEIDALPYSLFSDTYHQFSSGTEIRSIWFCNAFLGKIGWAKGIPLGENGFFVFGLRDDFLFQRTEPPDSNITQKGVRNVVSFPFAIEYRMNAVTLRFGTKWYYQYSCNKIRTNTATLDHWVTNTLKRDYSFGLAWQPHERVVIDLYNDFELDNIENWSLYVKYLF